MAIVTKLNGAGKTRERKLLAGLPLPQACRSLPAVRDLLRSGEVIRMAKSWTDPNKISEATYLLRRTEEELLVKLPTGVWYGAFHMRFKNQGKYQLRYTVTCICGGEYQLTTEELVTAMLEHTGCRRECCQQRTLLRLFWGTLVDSLTIQWKLIQACYPEHLPSYWGGTLDEVYERDTKYGFARAYQDMLRYKVDLTKPEFRWIRPLNPELPFTPDNIELSIFPWGPIAKLNKLTPVIAGQPIPVSELCQSLDVTVEQVLDALVYEDIEPDELVVALMQKGTTYE